jgi:protein-disulfide isomerase
LAIDGVVTTALLAASAVVIHSHLFAGRRTADTNTRGYLPVPEAPIPLQGAILRGNPQALIAVVAFFDFECSYCAKFARETWPPLLAKYVGPGIVLWAVRHFPIEAIHRDAVLAAAAGECARRQDRFWEFHDALFKDPSRLDRPALIDHAARINVDMPSFARCLDGDATEAVRRDILLAESLVVSGTPTFFLGRLGPGGAVTVTSRIDGFRPVTAFETHIQELLDGPAGRR